MQAMIRAGIAGIVCITTVSCAVAADFYRGKTLNIVVGFSAGGGYDMTARLYQRHLTRFLAGNPTVVVNNMSGAGSVVAATNLFNVTPQDGTRLGIIAGGAVIEPLLNSQAQYDARKFHWIGGRSVEPSITRRRSRRCRTQ